MTDVASRPVRSDDPAEIVRVGDGLVSMMGFTTMVAACIDCGTVIETMADALVHAHAARHRAECEQRSALTFAPAELFDGVR